ncbi:MAG: Cys-tRNA(Pro) deacylase [Myxococcales bacterium]|nr:Cys-tRNA(Pro) deacylase [Myxococcales bacterium]
MAKDRFPVTPALRALRAAGAVFEGHVIEYVPRGGTAHTAATLGVDEHQVIKTLIFEDEARAPLIVLMHGDRQVSGKALARLLGCKTITPCDPAVAERHSGYQVGGTSPFGTRKAMPVYLERSVAALPSIIINGGKRGFLLAMDPAWVVRVLAPTLVDVATD